MKWVEFKSVYKHCSVMSKQLESDQDIPTFVTIPFVQFDFFTYTQSCSFLHYLYLRILVNVKLDDSW